MRSALLCASSAEELFIISRLSRPAGRSKRIFTGGGVTANGICSAAFCESAALRETNSLRLMACALSVKAYGFASSPKGRAKSTPGSFLFVANTLVLNFTAWLPLWGSWRGSA